MRCQFCRRPLIASAVPGMKVGPKCAADRGLLPVYQQIRRVIDVDRESDPRQIDWINSSEPIDSNVGRNIIPERSSHISRTA